MVLMYNIIISHKISATRDTWWDVWMCPKPFDNRYINHWIFFRRTWKKLSRGNCYTTDSQTHIYMKIKCRKVSNCFMVGYVFQIDIVAWFTWIGEITAVRMLFNGNNSYHHFIISKILKSFLFNFPNWSFLREPCAYPHFQCERITKCCLPLNIFFSWVFGFGPPQVCIMSLRTIRCQHTNPFWTPDPE